MRSSIRRALTAGVAIGALHGAAVLADDPAPPSDAAPTADTAPAATVASSSPFGNMFSGMNFAISGFIRPEFAYSTNGRGDPFNQRGNPFNQRAVTRTNGTVAFRTGIPDNSQVHVNFVRLKIDTQTSFSQNWSFTAKMVAIYDPGTYSNFNPQAVGMRSTGEPIDSVYGRPNYFKYQVDGAGQPNPFEWAGRNYQVYFPAFFLEFNRGPVDVRLGNQQIAWGQALFFRVLDVVDGLDLRRHSVLDFASEEFSDKRVPAIALRVSYQISDDWLADAFIQKFQPTVFSNPNTPYNVIASQFTVHDLYADHKNGLDEGIRFKGSVGPIGLQGVFVHRYNPDGVFKWVRSGVTHPGDPPGLANTAFERDPTGVWSSQEWFYFAGASRLSGLQGLNQSINAFPAAQALGAVPVTTFAAAGAELDAFFTALGPLRGHIAREYFQEDDIGGGASYVFQGTPGSLTDQLILNIETMWTPNRTFTDPSLYRDVATQDPYVHKHEWTADFVLEKYQRLSRSLPATYFVLQGMHKTESDIFGRYLGGMGGDQQHIATGYGGGWTAFAFAFQQPFPSLIWRFDFAMLYDIKGGMLIQPAVRWKPNGHFTAEAFYNYLNAHIRNPNNNIVGTADWADEVSLRLGYQF